MLILYLILAILFWGIAPVFDKLAIKRVDVYTGIFYKNLVATVLFSVFYFIYIGVGKIFTSDTVGIIYYIISGICAGVIGMIFYFNALRQADASLVVPVVATYPLVSAILSVIFLKEQITVSRIIGIIFIIIGIWLIK